MLTTSKTYVTAKKSDLC